MDEIDELDGYNPWKFDLYGDVFYRDPDKGANSGYYKIIERVELSNEPGTNVYLLSNNRYNIEVYEKDLIYGKEV